MWGENLFTIIISSTLNTRENAAKVSLRPSLDVLQSPRNYLPVQSQQWKHQNIVWIFFSVKNKRHQSNVVVVPVSLLLTSNIFHFCC